MFCSKGGVSPRTSPLARVRDAGSLLSAAAFSLPVVDVDTITINYKTCFHLVEHLRRLGESNASMARRVFLSRDSALATAAVYHSLFSPTNQEPPGAATDASAGVSSTFQVIYISGWSPHQSQQTPAARGTATASLADLQSEIGKLEDGKRKDE